MATNDNAIKAVREALLKAKSERERLGAKIHLKKRIKLITNKRAYQ